jgi:DNA integrity scanning protein DisA with diadenylate cyclase activity
MTNTENNPTLKFTLNLRAFCIFLFIFVIEVIIALFVKDKIIRPYGGDVLVVIMIYYFVKTFIKTKPIYLAIGVVLFAYGIEIGQYYNLVEVLNLQDNKVMRIVIGSSFSWGDMVCYTIGALICLLIDRQKTKVDID